MKTRYLLIIALLLTFATSCKKYLEENPNKSLAVPTTVDDFQNLMDNNIVYSSSSPSYTEFSADDISIPFVQLQTIYFMARDSYLWADDIYQGNGGTDWNVPYQGIYFTNVVLDGIKSVEIKDQSLFNQVKGQALFYRGFLHYQLSQAFAKPYNATAAAQELGIPYKSNSLVDAKISRGTLQETYDAIIADLKSSISLLPLQVQFQYRNRPSKPSAYAILSRVYLSMSDYKNAKLYADSCLNIYSDLTDYNSITPSPTPFGRPYIVEVMNLSGAGAKMSWMPVNSNLYNSYDSNDLRKKLFFRQNISFGTYEFHGNYSAGSLPFTGPATDEIYLNRAECLARVGNFSDALVDLNHLLEMRYQTGTFVPYTVSNTTDVLGLILNERRKELVFRGIRWTDLRRFNLEGGRFAKDIVRVSNGVTYTLKANDPKYVFLIPPNEIRLSGIPQNPR